MRFLYFDAFWVYLCFVNQGKQYCAYQGFKEAVLIRVFGFKFKPQLAEKKLYLMGFDWKQANLPKQLENCQKAVWSNWSPG